MRWPVSGMGCRLLIFRLFNDGDNPKGDNMKIIKAGRLPKSDMDKTFTGTCKQCRCVYEFTKGDRVEGVKCGDYTLDQFVVIACPTCDAWSAQDVREKRLRSTGFLAWPGVVLLSACATWLLLAVGCPG